MIIRLVAVHMFVPGLTGRAGAAVTYSAAQSNCGLVNGGTAAVRVSPGLLLSSRSTEMRRDRIHAGRAAIRAATPSGQGFWSDSRESTRISGYQARMHIVTVIDGESLVS